MHPLEGAYLATTYRAHLPERTIAFRIGQYVPVLDEWLQASGYHEWGFVSAVNPRSCLLSENENLERHRCLLAWIQSKHFLAFPGEGIPDTQTWPIEPSLLVVGIGRSVLLDLGRSFEQNAVVLGSVGSIAELAWCDF